MVTFYRGVLFLAASAFLGESIEFLVNMILVKELGKHGLGLYMSILPSIFLIVLLSSFELQVSISKFIAEKERRYHRSILHHALTIAIIFMSLLFLIAMATIPYVSVFDSYHPYTRWLVIILIPIISFTSVARGYFMGSHQMGKIALSNFLRKAFQLAVFIGIFRYFQFDTQTAVLIAIGTLIGSEVIVLLYLVCTFIIQYQHMKRLPFSNLNRRVVRKNLMSVSIPTTGLRLFAAFTTAIQPFLIKTALIRSGLTDIIATEQFGMLAGIAISIGFFPAFIAHSLLIVLIPTVSKAYSEKDYAALQKMLNHVIRITFLYGVPAVAIFYFFGSTLTSKFFHSTDAAVFLQMLWPFFLFHFFIIPTQAFLIGLGMLKDIFLQTIWSTAISYSIILYLGSLPEWRMQGVMIGMNTGAVLLSLMHYLTVCKKIRVSILTRDLIHES
ncbi:oligosaccharide flippase family protein [Neobacillus sp. PS3-40]|uniref:oligosaccharide flippase family protein n=1 Tax=Neobacillus sp. PS3-40 TaxID=3070679 RepID=UPI0027E140C8|nr:oligosaccharide flippase family protein [Neobacillus sp. PS3-40]WML42957.1 oligosaccharide flippase family protein [Neobacillus sp. PS3-40]